MLLQKEKKVNMTFAFAAKKLSVRALPKDVLVIDMDMGEMKTSSGIVIQSDDGKAHGIKPRWAKVYKVGTEVQDIKEGQWVLIEHGRWTRKIKIDDGQSEKEFQKVETKSIMMVADERPNDIYIGQEYGHGSSATIRPEDFGAR
jgi:co-chaperonin GroES (HSP10)